MAHLLIVDDEEMHRQLAVEYACKPGDKIHQHADARSALECFERHQVDVLITDLLLGDGEDGWWLIAKCREIDPHLPVVIMSGYIDDAGLQRAVRLEAREVFLKNWGDTEALAHFRDGVNKGIEQTRVRGQAEGARERIAQRDRRRPRLLGSSPAIQELKERMVRIAKSPGAVLIEGETGVGKEVVARTLHSKSASSAGPFHAVSIPELSTPLISSELFGSVRGAYTSATKDRLGRFRAANGGTIFLDEIGDIDAESQAKLLRFLETHEVTPVGGHRTILLDVRVIAATNQPLMKLVEAGQFRKDLYYRLRVHHLEVPPLSRRRGDIPELAEHFLNTYLRENRRHHPSSIEPKAKALIESFSWPGNVRELKSFVERLVPHCDRASIDEDLVRAELLRLPGCSTKPAVWPDSLRSLDEYLADEEKSCLLRALELSDWNQRGAARICGLAPSTLRSRLERHGISETKARERKPSRAPKTRVQPKAGDGKHILFVDDDEKQLRSLATLVRATRPNDQVTLAVGGVKAIEILEDGPEFDLVLCDLIMDDKNGTIVFDWIKQTRPEIRDRFVLLTAYLDTPEAGDLLDGKDCRVARKPLTMDMLAELLGEPPCQHA